MGASALEGDAPGATRGGGHPGAVDLEEECPGNAIQGRDQSTIVKISRDADSHNGMKRSYQARHSALPMTCLVSRSKAERLSKVRWGVAQEMLVAWGLTIPVTAGLAALAYLPIQRLV